jgi:hypothetical protein
MLKIWNTLPVAARWILLFPIVFIATLLLGITSRMLLLAGGLPLQILDLIYPPLMGMLALFSFFHLAPKGKLILLKVLISLRSLFIPLFIAFAIFRHLGADIEMSWEEYWTPFIGEILTLACSIWLYKHLKQEYTEP